MFLALPEMARLLKAAHPGRRIATRVAPKPLLRLLALFDPALRTVLPVIDARQEASAAKAERLLGMRFRDVRDSLRETAGFLLAGRDAADGPGGLDAGDGAAMVPGARAAGAGAVR